MNKTISINLNGLIFNLEEDAYERLNAYLEGLKQHFGTADYGKEIVNDIEDRISEQFSSKIKDRKQEVVTMAGVEEIIKNMGALEDLTGEGKKSETSSDSVRRKLYRNPDDQIIAGVSSGIASYFNINPLIPRLLFVATTLAGGWGILLYIIMWIIVPEALTSAEKLEMRGNAVTIANLEESKKTREPKNFSIIKYFFQELFYLIGRFFRALGPIILLITGLFLTVFSFIASFGVILSAIVLLFNPESAYIDPTVAQVFEGNKYFFIIVSAFMTSIIPILTALLLGISFIRRRNVFTGRIGIIFSVIWLSGALTLGFIAASAAPQIDAAIKAAQEQPLASKEFTVGEFNSIETSHDQMVKVVYGTDRKIVAYGRDEEINNLEIEIENNRLQFSTARRNYKVCLICINQHITLEITTPVLEEINAHNAQVEIMGFNNLTSLTVNATSASRVVFDGDVKTLNLDLANASRAELQGTAQTVNAEISNASRIVADNFIINEITIDADNASRAEFNVTGRINANVRGASKINYKGNPTIEEISTSNAGKVTEE